MKKILMVFLPISLFVFSCEDVASGVNGVDGVGAVRVDWDTTFGRTLSEWLDVDFLYEVYYKITTIGE